MTHAEERLPTWEKSGNILTISVKKNVYLDSTEGLLMRRIARRLEFATSGNYQLKTPRLLVLERLDRIEFSGAVGRQRAEHDANKC